LREKIAAGEGKEEKGKQILWQGKARILF